LLQQLVLIALARLVDPGDGGARVVRLELGDQVLEVGGERLVAQRPGLEVDLAAELGIGVEARWGAGVGLLTAEAAARGQREPGGRGDREERLASNHRSLLS